MGNPDCSPAWKKISEYRKGGPIFEIKHQNSFVPKHEEEMTSQLSQKLSPGLRKEQLQSNSNKFT